MHDHAHHSCKHRDTHWLAHNYLMILYLILNNQSRHSDFTDKAVSAPLVSGSRCIDKHFGTCSLADTCLLTWLCKTVTWGSYKSITRVSDSRFQLLNYNVIHNLKFIRFI